MTDDDRQTPDEKAELRRRAERALEQKSGEPPASWTELSPETMRSLLHELHVHQVELEMQNEELRKIQHELALSRERYFELYDVAPVGYVSVSGKGLVLEANLTFARLVRLAPEELVNRPFSRFVLWDDQDAFYLLRKQVLDTPARVISRALKGTGFGLGGIRKPEESPSCELRMVRSDGSEFWAKLIATVAKDGEPEDSIWVVVTDISGRHMERKLR
ncbi:hypothetical protein CWI75_12080 [Kineobactrum sediminis]|uniref:PAS domain-containing protein n=1 Tax=Kineobactrum sediminis TaxID=1905677 RepID=A0A2N5Y263_9GAMM|nr:PAS domain-containing protein [Kineobactrum sediminis]PLW82483.1 hypothetical protein CWI75_12080 [Kineobactrum sediminis]